MEELNKNDQIRELSRCMLVSGERFSPKQRFSMFKMFVDWYDVGEKSRQPTFDEDYTWVVKVMGIENFCIESIMKAIYVDIQRWVKVG
jgi:hypothetical protein